MNPHHKTPPPFPDLDLIFVEGGDFRMGTPEDDSEGYSWERPTHKVTVPSFYMACYPVTQRLWQAVMGDNPSEFQGEKRPVEQVSWDDAQTFIDKLNALPDVQRYLEALDPPGGKFRLPTEAEWEYAARGGKHSKGFRYAGSDRLEEVGWYEGNSHDETKPVGLKLPNELGLHDMSGNVFEWCADAWIGVYTGGPNSGGGWLNFGGQNRYLLRGGSWCSVDDYCQVVSNYWYYSDDRFDCVGFRLAR